MRRTLRILAVVSIGFILIYLLFLVVEAVVVRKAFDMSVFMQLGSILLGFGSLLFQLRKLKAKHQLEETESALDDDITRIETPEIHIPGVLKFANGLFAVWTGWVAVTLLGMYGGGDLQIRLVWILVAGILCAFTCLFIVGVGIIEFFTPSKNATSKTIKEPIDTGDGL